MFLADGSPDGIVTAEIMNWTGHVLSAPRSRLPDVLNRPEAQRTGLYILFGDPTPGTSRRACYVGESDDVGRRVAQHNRDGDKDFFERFCLVTNKDLNLTKAHTRYLESEIVRTARELDRADILNGNEPPAGILSESDIADMRTFFDQLSIVLPVLGYDVLKALPTGGRAPVEDGDQRLRLVLQSPAKRPLEANAVESNGEVTVLKGSEAVANPRNATSEPYRIMREKMLEEGSLEPVDGATLRFARDVPFSSPSAASGFIYGRSDNGRTSWLVEGSSTTLRDHQLRVQEESERGANEVVTS